MDADLAAQRARDALLAAGGNGPTGGGMNSGPRPIGVGTGAGSCWEPPPQPPRKAATIDKEKSSGRRRRSALCRSTR